MYNFISHNIINSVSYVLLDIDECKEEYPCSQLCHNTQGSYKCFCETGYLSLDGGMTCKANSCK